MTGSRFIKSVFLVVAVLFLSDLSVSAETITDEQRQKFRKAHAEFSKLRKMCIDECIKNVGSTFSYTSPQGKRCRKGHDLMDEGMLLWLKGQAAKTKGNMQAYGEYDRNARVYIVSGGVMCPKTKKKVVRALKLMP